jgi:sporulation protein YlmC with PRC-barrel domain
MERALSKTTLTAAFAVMMAAAAPVAFAQTPSQPTHPMTPGSTGSATTGSATSSPAERAGAAFKTQSGALRAAELIGSTVYDVHNRNIGSVKDIVLNSEGKVDAVVVDVGAFLGMGGKYVAVSLNDIKTDNNRLTLNRTKEQLEAAQPYVLDQKKG